MKPVIRTPGLSLEIMNQLRQYARRSRADNTQRTYAAQWRAFNRWCSCQGCQSLPAAPLTVAAYLVQRAQAGAALNTINGTLAAIGFVHTAAGLPFERAHPELGLVVAGIRREHVRPQRQAEPLTGVLLRQVLTGLDTTPAALRDGALLAVLYTFGLRRSEAAALDWMQLGSGRGWLTLAPQQAEVVLLGSKAAAGTIERVRIPAQASPRTLRAVRRWTHQARIESGTPLFRPLTRSGQPRHARLHIDSIGWIIKCVMLRHFLRQGLEPKHAEARARLFSGHSGRLGLCVSSAEAGVPAQQIAAAARHRGLATTLRYCREADMLVCAPHARKGVGV